MGGFDLIEVTAWVGLTIIVLEVSDPIFIYIYLIMVTFHQFESILYSYIHPIITVHQFEFELCTSMARITIIEVKVMVFNATFSNNSVISWWSVY